MQTKSTTINRRRMILQLLSEKGEVYVRDLSKDYSVSEVTIRKDLIYLEQKSMLIRSRGGALRLEKNSELDRFNTEKTRINFQQKARIGRVAADLLEEDDTIIIGPGTTTTEFARNIPEDMRMTVITNSIPVLHHLISKPMLTTIVLGGNMMNRNGVLTGPITEMALKNFYVDKVFLGADGCDSRRGIFTSDLETAQVMQMMINNSREVILLSDSTKFYQKSLTLMCSFERVNIVVTDDRLSKEDKKYLEDNGSRVILT